MKGRDYSKFWWNRAVPVKKSKFISLLKSGEKYNVEVDLGAIAAFSGKRKPIPADELLYSDQQQSVILNMPEVMGSARSGFYRGGYLKGVGRTLLAGNWNSNELYHCSGHLLPSAAIREWVVTQYLHAKGRGGKVVQSQGILLKPLDADLKRFPSKAFPKTASSTGYSAPIDFRFQAITYKEDNFARSSNILWSLNQIGTFAGGFSHFPIQDFIQMFSFYLNPQRFSKGKAPDTHALGKLHASDVAGLYAEALNRTLDNFYSQFEAGIYWSSFNNNYALDGRFLDLEAPLFLGGAFFGGLSKSSPLKSRNQISASESFTSHFTRIMGDLRLFTESIRSRLAFLIEHRCFSRSIEQDYAEELLAELKTKVGEQAPWMDSSALRIQHLDKMLKTKLDLDSRDHARLNSSIRHSEIRLKKYDAPRAPQLKMNRVDSFVSPSEAQVKIDLYVADFFQERFNRENLEEFEFMNALLAGLMKRSDLDDLLFHLQGVRNSIDRFFKK